MWHVVWRPAARKQLAKIDKQSQQQIIDYLATRVETEHDPCRFGAPLKGDKSGYWRYRIGRYRIICEIDRGRLVVVAVAVGHRKDVYQ